MNMAMLSVIVRVDVADHAVGTLVMVNRQIAAAARDTAAAIHNAACMPLSNEEEVAISVPNTAIPNAAPVCLAELSTPAAMPARLFSTVPMAGAVAAGEMKPAAMPIAGMDSAASQ